MKVTDGLGMTHGWSIGSPVDLRARLGELETERIFARSYGMAADAAYMTDLEAEVAEVTAVYIAAAVTELATLRGELIGPQLG
jgi:hypothetical protein